MNTTTRTAAHAIAASLTFGVEIETYGLGDDRAAKVVQSVVGGTLGLDRRGNTTVTATDGRVWLAMHDGSITGNCGSEVVTPILKGDADVNLLQTVVRALRAAGGKSDAAHQCGVHVHIGTQGLDVAAVGRVVKTVAKLDTFIRKAAGVSADRSGWCRPLHMPTNSGHIANVPALARARTLDQLARAWYGSAEAARYARTDHYNGSRYHGLNLHSMFYTGRGTVEFRYFDGTLHAGKIRSYVALCQAIVARSVVQTSASAKVREITTVKQAMTLLTADLGMVGEAFAVVRTHLTAAWRVGGIASESEAA